MAKNSDKRETIFAGTIAAYHKMAEVYGANLHFEETFKDYEILRDTDIRQGEKIKVTTTKESYITKKLVLCMGAWAPAYYNHCLPDNVKLKVIRKVALWLDTPKIDFKDKVIERY